MKPARLMRDGEDPIIGLTPWGMRIPLDHFATIKDTRQSLQRVIVISFLAFAAARRVVLHDLPEADLREHIEGILTARHGLPGPLHGGTEITEIRRLA
jgi:hypothetical protein